MLLLLPCNGSSRCRSTDRATWRVQSPGAGTLQRESEGLQHWRGRVSAAQSHMSGQGCELIQESRARAFFSDRQPIAKCNGVSLSPGACSRSSGRCCPSLNMREIGHVLAQLGQRPGLF